MSEHTDAFGRYLIQRNIALNGQTWNKDGLVARLATKYVAWEFCLYLSISFHPSLLDFLKNTIGMFGALGKLS